MAFFQINNVRVAGMAASVPRQAHTNHDNPVFKGTGAEEFIKGTGIAERRLAPAGVNASDLCLAAAEKLLAELGWAPADVEVLIFVSQTPDFRIPATSTILQHRLGLSKECLAFDIPLGCSGYVYGLSSIAAMLSASGLKKGLLLVGDTISKVVSPKDKSTHPLFGDAGSATALQYAEGADPMYFHLGTDGAGYQAIMIPDGGAASPSCARSLEEEEIADGVVRSRAHLQLEGMDVFSFGISQAPATVKSLLEGAHIDKGQVDYFVFHQANMMMNKMIAKKLGLPVEKVPYSLARFGNTASATIPLTIVSELQQEAARPLTWILCGFGVGLSWGTAAITTNGMVCPELIEL